MQSVGTLIIFHEQSTHFVIVGFTDYCLEVDPDKRPDIFQVGSVAFGILGRQCAINTNLNVSLLVDHQSTHYITIRGK